MKIAIVFGFCATLAMPALATQLAAPTDPAVVEVYQVMLGRQPDPMANTWENFHQMGFSKQSLCLAIAQHPETMERHGSRENAMMACRHYIN